MDHRFFTLWKKPHNVICAVFRVALNKIVIELSAKDLKIRHDVFRRRV